MYKGRKFIQAKIRAIGIYTRIVCGWGRKLYKPVQIRGLYKKKELYGRVV